MSDSSTFSPEEQVLADFTLELERLGVEGVDLSGWITRHPELESRLRGLRETQRALEATRPEAEPPLPERLGEFRIVRRIARGGMGDIFEAVQEPLERRVAVKTIRQGRMSLDMQKRFLREQKVLASLHQTHIVPIHTAGAEGELQYFAMPYIEGAALHNVVQVLGEIQSYRPDTQTPPLGDLALIAGADTGGEDEDTITHIGGIRFREGEAGDFDDSVPRNLSGEYFRSVARVMADVADAVQHAHDNGILHRDIKPSNIMIDTHEQCWMIDFGLARYVRHSVEESLVENQQAVEAGLTATPEVVGTLQYMAPEQFDGDAERRTDVWALGATLYELLTLQQAFPGESFQQVRDAVQSARPTPLRQLVRRLPGDLNAICTKAMQLDPAQRYESASGLADDLRRFLRDEPTAAHRIRAPRRAWKWARRNKGWASAIGLLFVVLGILAWSGFALANASAREARTARRSTLITEARSLRVGSHVDGWSNEAWSRIREAARIQSSSELRDEAAAALSGFDARIKREFSTSADAIAFDARAERLLMSGCEPMVVEHNPTTRIWSGELTAPDVLAQLPAGPVGFRESGEPIQLVVTEHGSLVLLDVTTGATVAETTPSELVDGEAEISIGDPVEASLSSNGATIAAAYKQAGQGDGDVIDRVFCWHADSGRHQWITTPSAALCLSADGGLLATAGPDGEVSIWNSVDGHKLRSFSSGIRHPSVLRFSPIVDAEVFEFGGSPPALDPRLAVAGSGGIGVFQLPNIAPVSICRESMHDIHAMEFSPDGTLLVSCGRVHASLWDVGTGKEILRFNRANTMTDVAFAPDGQHIAVSSIAAHEDETGRVRIWELEFGRGIDELRGARARVECVVLSSTGKYVAALCQDWRIVVWNLSTRRLIRMFQAPPGYFADNAALRFDPEDTQIAFSAGTQAIMWDLQSGEETGFWPLPPGLQDELSFGAEGRLRVFRMEAESKAESFLRGVSPATDPRVCRLHELVAGQPARIVSEIMDLNAHAFSIVASPDGQFFVVEGLRIPATSRDRAIMAVDAQSGEVRWSIPTDKEVLSAQLAIDPSSRILAYDTDGGATTQVVDLESGRLVMTLRPSPYCLSRQSGLAASPAPGRMGYQLFALDDPNPLVTLGGGVEASGNPSFNSDGRLLTWGNRNGTVTVCDIETILENLTEIGLAW